MIKTVYPLKDKVDTGREMKRLIELYHNDLDSVLVDYKGKKVALSKLPLKDYFDFVRKIPYRMDTKPREVVARPGIILKNSTLGMDCKKKAVLIGSWIRRNGLKYRLIASSKRPDKTIHHVFPQIRVNGFWKNADATYDYYKLFEPKKDITKVELL